MSNEKGQTRVSYYKEDEIDITTILRLLIDRKWFIFGVTAAIVVLSVVYVLSVPFTYKTSVYVSYPSDSSMEKINQLQFIDETKKTVFQKFLNKVTSAQLQESVLYESEAGGVFLKNDKSIVGSITVELDDALGFSKGGNLSIENGNKSASLIFLNKVVSQAKQAVLDDFLHLSQMRSIVRLNDVSSKLTFLNLVRKNAQEQQMQQLLDALKMSTDLNLDDSALLSSNKLLMTDLSGVSNPQNWYLLGSKVLKTRIDILQQEKQYPSMEALQLQGEKKALESYKADVGNINLVQTGRQTYVTLAPHRKRVIAAAFIVGFVISILLVLLSSIFSSKKRR